MVHPQKSLAHKLPSLASQWDNERNDKLPTEVTVSSAYKAWWRCPTCTHSWQTSVNARKNGKGCPQCAGRVVTPGTNDFASQRPEYLPWWKDQQISPQEVVPGSRRKVTWGCPAGHTFQQEVRKFRGTCPRCAKHPILLHSPHLASEWSKENALQPHEVSYNSAQNVIWNCTKCNNKWETPAYSRTNGSGCPKCSRSARGSRAESQLAEALANLGLIEGADFIRHARPGFLRGLELDFFLPSRNVAIEYNGLYFHSEARGKTRRSHYDKWLACKKNGIQLIYVWEDDYNRNPTLIHKMIAHKTGLSSEKKAYARHCSLREIDHQEASKFLEQYHIQGATNQCNRHLGLFHNETLVAVSTWLSSGETLHLQRYATNCHVIGGMGKMLNHMVQQKSILQFNRVVTFAAHDVSDGSLYESLGFVAERELPPDYSYLYKGKRVHKFNFRLKRFREDPDLRWEEGLTESQLAALNSIPRIWDAGKTRYALSI